MPKHRARFRPQVNSTSLAYAYWARYQEVLALKDIKQWDFFLSTSACVADLWRLDFNPPDPSKIPGGVRSLLTQPEHTIPAIQEFTINIFENGGYPKPEIRALIKANQPLPPDPSVPAMVLRGGSEGIILLEGDAARKFFVLTNEAGRRVAGWHLAPPRPVLDAHKHDAVGLSPVRGTPETILARYATMNHLPGFIKSEVVTTDDYIEVRMPRRSFDNIPPDAYTQWLHANEGIHLNTINLDPKWGGTLGNQGMRFDPEKKRFIIIADVEPSNISWNADKTGFECADAILPDLTDDDFHRVIGLRYGLHHWVDRFGRGTDSNHELPPLLKKLETATRLLDSRFETWNDADPVQRLPLHIDPNTPNDPLCVRINDQDARIHLSGSDYRKTVAAITASPDRVHFILFHPDKLDAVMRQVDGNTLDETVVHPKQPIQSMPAAQWEAEQGPTPVIYERTRNAAAAAVEGRGSGEIVGSSSLSDLRPGQKIK